MPLTKSEKAGPVLSRSLNAVGFLFGSGAVVALSDEVVAYARDAARNTLGRVAVASRHERQRYPEIVVAIEDCVEARSDNYTSSRELQHLDLERIVDCF